MQIGFEVFHRDVDTLVRFYVQALGFTAEPADDPDGHRVVQRDGVRIGCCHDPAARAVQRRPPHGSEIVLRVADLDAEHGRAMASGWPIADPLQQRPWGQRDFRMHDPSGQYLRISSRS